MRLNRFAGGIGLAHPQFDASADLPFDGRDVTPTGPTVPEGITYSATKIDDRTFQVVTKVGGKVLAAATNVLSSDRRTLTSTTVEAGADQHSVEVYERE